MSSNLPVDVDVDVNVDADYIYISNSGNDYTIDRHYDCSYYLDGVRYYPTIIPSGPNKMEYEIGYYPHGDRLSQPVDSFHCCPYTKSYDNTYRYAENPNSSRSISYWYSPSLNFVFAFADNKVKSALYSDDCTVLNFATTSYDTMNYPRVGASNYVAVPTYLYDLNVGTCSYVFNVFINYCDGNCYLPYCEGSYSAMCMYYYPQNNDSYDGLFHLVKDYWSTYPLYIGPKRSSSYYSSYYGLGSTAYSVNANYLPNDLLCIFSTYTIPGYFTLDNSGYKTPSYYFQYQYLYFKQDSGYVFIDSSSPLDSISRPTDGNCKITFTDYANCHIYISSDGYTWKELTTISTMYCKSFQTTYGYFFGGTSVTDSVFSAVLVYSSDDSLEKEPQFKPTDFPDPTDLAGNLNSILDGYDTLDIFEPQLTLPKWSFCPDLPSLTNIDASSFFIKLFMSDFCYVLKYSAPLEFNDTDDSYPDYLYMYCITNRDPGDLGAPVININFNSATYNYTFESCSKVAAPIAYFRLMSNSLGNIDTTLQVFRDDLSLQLGSIHGNISSLGITLSSVLDAVKGIKLDNSDVIKAIQAIKIPKEFDDSNIISSLQSLRFDNSDVVKAIQVLNIPDKFDDTDILSAISNISIDSFNDSAVISAINSVENSINSLNIPDSFDDSAIIDAINGISINVSGGVYQDDSGLLGDICDYFDDDGMDSNGLYTFVSDTLDDVSQNIHFSDFITFSDDLMRGIKFTNRLVGSVYDNLGDLKPVILCGAGFTLVAIVLRKERAT